MMKKVLKSYGLLAIVFSLALIIYFIPSQVNACYISGNCRVTGGGVTTSGIDPTGGWDGTLAQGKDKMGKGQANFYTFGGQAGANTAYPEPQGEWTHHQNGGPAGYFVFHGYSLDVISCSDPGPCNPAAANGEFKQIDFGGWGRFNNFKDNNFTVNEENYHWFEVHIEDLGEPGNKPRGVNVPASTCPSVGAGTDFFNGLFGPANCGCPDFYRFRIRATADPSSHIIYEVWGYLTGGNFQIHQPTGFDMDPSQ